MPTSRVMLLECCKKRSFLAPQDLCAALGLPVWPSHRALPDAQATAELCAALLSRRAGTAEGELGSEGAARWVQRVGAGLAGAAKLSCTLSSVPLAPAARLSILPPPCRPWTTAP
jgi:hypothetical protein